ncbi:RICIN domain-containing protein [Saccharothrix obliqua]|uniref:RICIN domain-containing protein n=1 Tax=Saccharothrix obliqua TaxID=2861747 RepID=UPI001C5EAAA7|nr:RICIN domain-containing protein [Saccharothrix obliqua]MBW4722059.1 RICIN domain-containing protein [Saccharothrix obliqua]
MSGVALVAGLSGLAVASASPDVSTRGVDTRQASLRLAANPGLVANVANSATNNGAPLVLWGWDGGNNARWEPDASLDGFYRFRSINSGRCLNVQYASTADGAQIIQYDCGGSPNELWKLVPKAIGYQVVNKNSGKCLNVEGGVAQGRNLIQYTCSQGGATNDVWLVVWEA